MPAPLVETPALTLARQLAMTPSVSGQEESAVRLVANAMQDLGFDEGGQAASHYRPPSRPVTRASLS